jgi:hypothetical protein
MAAAATRTALEWRCHQRLVIRPRWRSAHNGVCESVNYYCNYCSLLRPHSTQLVAAAQCAHTHTHSTLKHNANKMTRQSRATQVSKTQKMRLL